MQNKIYITNYSSPLGACALASDGESLVGLWLKGQKYYMQGMPEEVSLRDDLPVFIAAKDWLAKYFSGEKPRIFTPPLAPSGSEFRRRVWDILREIPYGSTITYGDIARRLGCSSAQAIGGAVGHNPISIIIPCHRVVGANGTLTGYAGGLNVKRKLLEMEGFYP